MKKEAEGKKSRLNRGDPQKFNPSDSMVHICAPAVINYRILILVRSHQNGPTHGWCKKSYSWEALKQVLSAWIGIFSTLRLPFCFMSLHSFFSVFLSAILWIFIMGSQWLEWVFTLSIMLRALESRGHSRREVEGSHVFKCTFLYANIAAGSQKTFNEKSPRNSDPWLSRSIYVSRWSKIEKVINSQV